MDFHSPDWKKDMTIHYPKGDKIEGMTEVLMYDIPVKRIGDKTILEETNVES